MTFLNISHIKHLFFEIVIEANIQTMFLHVPVVLMFIIIKKLDIQNQL